MGLPRSLLTWKPWMLLKCLSGRCFRLLCTFFCTRHCYHTCHIDWRQGFWSITLNFVIYYHEDLYLSLFLYTKKNPEYFGSHVLLPSTEKKVFYWWDYIIILFIWTVKLYIVLLFMEKNLFFSNSGQIFTKSDWQSINWYKLLIANNCSKQFF